MSRRVPLWVCSLLVLGGMFAGCEQKLGDPRQPPNIVVIVSDDLGYAQLGANGAAGFPTPHIDSIGRQGINFSNGYVSASICAPSRAGLMTGRHQARYGYESLTGSLVRQIEKEIGVPSREILLPRLLKDAGYATAVIGKWHLGSLQRFHPNNRGVDYFFGFLAKGRYYWEEGSPTKGAILRNQEEVKGEGYLTEVFAEEAAEFIHRNANEPFFLYYAPWNVHIPRQVPERYIPPGGTIMDGMVSALDASVGVILEALQDEGLEQNTLVVFINDNGAKRSENNHPYRGGKGGLFEGGIRVPFSMRWPAGLPAGQVYDEPVSQLDILPTALSIAGGHLPEDREFDGIDLMPYLLGNESGVPHSSLYWRQVDATGHIVGYAVRSRDLKLVIQPGNGEEPESVALYDLAADPGETRNLAPLLKRETAKLRQAIHDWDRKVGAPRTWRMGASAAGP